MCGVAGILLANAGWGEATLAEVATRMAHRLRHRGPDDSGVWADPQAGIAIGHRRLSIVDLSADGHQPMHSACGRYAIGFNGEIYNHSELRDELVGSGSRFRGRSDTEVMLEAISRWGLGTALERFNGMFAFALWDKEGRKLHLVRDRMGEKPLYYAWRGRIFVFGSELKALREAPGFEAAIDREALALYLRHSYVPAPRTIYQGVSKLAAGSWATVFAAAPGAVDLHRFWSARAVAACSAERRWLGSPEDAVLTLEELLRDAVRLRMRADVPVGAFLSGGIDSSTVVALMQAQSTRPVKTFTISFAEKSYDESAQAGAVAAHLGTEHVELRVTGNDARAVVPRLPEIYDEPFADSSQIPTFLVAQLARSQVTVALSGDGGDELFAGYPSHARADSLWRAIGWLPPRGQRLLAAPLAPLAAWHELSEKIGLPLPRVASPLFRRARKLAAVLRAERNEDRLALEFASHDADPARLALGAEEPEAEPRDPRGEAALAPAERLMLTHAVGYLPDDILAKVDRATMAVGLEARVPLLDHRLFELAFRFPLALKLRAGEGKWILRRVAERLVPRALIDRPKQGFSVPVADWLRGPLRGWAADVLDEAALRREGYLDAPRMARKLRWLQHGADGEQHVLWNALMFQCWLRHALERPT